MTIKRRINIALFLMILIPVGLMIGAVGMTRHVMELPRHGGEPFPVPRFGLARAVPFIGIFGTLILCNSLLSWWVSSGVIRPLSQLKLAAFKIGDGDLDFRLPTKQYCSEFNELAQAFETMRVKLKASLERQLADETSRRKLIADVSHDLRTPISVIRGYAEGLRDGVASDVATRDRYIRTIIDRAGELEQLIEMLFSYSTVDLNGIQPQSIAMDLRLFLSKQMREFQDLDQVDGRRISIGMVDDQSPQGQGAQILADPNFLTRIMNNLVHNALRHGGHDFIEMSWRLTDDGDRVELTVADNGTGVAEVDLPQLFEPFFRGERSRMGPGAGLGLAIVRQLMQAMGGNARAEMATTGGLAIILDFPKAVIHA